MRKTISAPRRGTPARALRAMVALAALAIATAPAAARADGFSAAATPSRFELEAKAGQVLSRTIELQHVGTTESEYLLRSADWSLGEERGLEFFAGLQAGSCRPWLRLERKTVRLRPNEKRRIRFEVHVPADAPRGECRFALMVEGSDSKQVSIASATQVQLPLSGRLGIIVYVAIEGAQPKLELDAVAAVDDRGRRVPAVVVRNTGDAHGRLDGALRGVDASGKALLFPVSTLPLMPGQRRTLPLTPMESMTSRNQPELAWPVKLDGRLDWSGGGIEVAQEVK
ncbi:MAG: hypothetical protein AB7P21_01660 [Lautropia sp.]